MLYSLLGRIAAFLVLLGALAFAAPAAQAAPNVTVRVTIDKIEAIDGFEGGGDADFYSIVTIDGQDAGKQGPIIDNDTADPDPDWVFEKSIDAAKRRVPVSIEVRDEDGGFRLGDDHADIDPTNGGDTFNLDFDVNFSVCGTQSAFPAVPGTSGDASISCGSFATSAGTADNNKARITYKVEVIDADADGDALPDNWELGGVDADNNGTVDLNLANMGARYNVKDVFVEVDCVVATDHSHCPRLDALTDVAQAFSNSPTDGNTGVQLHIDVGPVGSSILVIRNVPPFNGTESRIGDLGGGGSQIPEAGNTVIDWDGATGSPGTSFYALKNTYFNAGIQNVRKAVFRYAIFGHQTNLRAVSNDCTSGWEEGRPSNDFMVTLGGRRDISTPPDGVGDTACWGETAAGDGIDNDGDGKIDEDRRDNVDNDGDCVPGTDTDGDGAPCDYGDVGVDEDGGQSVGTRQEQAGGFMHELGHTLGLRHGGTADTPNNKPNYLSVMNYTWNFCTVPTSPAGATTPIPGGCDYSRTVVNLDERNPPGLDECLGLGPGLGFGRVNWDGDSPAVFEGATCPAPNTANVSADINGDGATTALPGYNDWANLFYNFRSLANYGSDGQADPSRDEPDPESIEAARRRLSTLLAPAIKVAVSGPDTALPGDNLTYAVRTSNDGGGPAFGVQLALTRPSGAVSNFDLGDMVVGAADSRTVTHSVPADACPQTLKTAGTAVFRDIVQLVHSASGSKETKVLDITPPKIQLSLSPTSLWPPNHKLVTITATVSATDECDPNPQVRLISVSSSEPDNGLGDGDTPNDVAGASTGADDRSFQLRSERGGAGTGRTYTVVYEARDASGNAARATATVRVPKTL